MNFYDNYTSSYVNWFAFFGKPYDQEKTCHILRMPAEILSKIFDEALQQISYPPYFFLGLIDLKLVCKDFRQIIQKEESRYLARYINERKVPIRRLDVSANKIVRFMQSLGSRVTHLNLRYLNLSRMEYFNILHGCRNIRELVVGRLPIVQVLSQTDFSGEAVRVLSLQHQLSSLKLLCANISDSDIQSLVSRVETLKSLTLVDCFSISLMSYSSLGMLTNLRKLDLSYQPVTYDQILALQPLQKLERLKLKSANMDNRSMLLLSQFPKLTWLRVNCIPFYYHHYGVANISDEGIKSISACSSLQVLQLECPFMTDVGVGHLTKLTQLRVLKLVGSNVADGGLRSIGQMEHLKELSLTRSALMSTYALRQLQINRPDMKIDIHDHYFTEDISFTASVWKLLVLSNTPIVTPFYDWLMGLR